ncbi:hypothetical protein Leryth_002366 [Lithospermum erythrorhizon]|nr:hypothetical protein Leryth_002366 [Lithospermum erythrorhizon]
MEVDISPTARGGGFKPALVESRPEVGSSKNRSEGPCMISTPIETLRRSPPETPRVPSSPINKKLGLIFYVRSHMQIHSDKDVRQSDLQIIQAVQSTSPRINVKHILSGTSLQELHFYWMIYCCIENYCVFFSCNNVHVNSDLSSN